MRITVSYCLSTLLFGFLVAELAWGGQESDLQDYYRRTDDLSTRTNTVAMLALLAELDTVELWSFGAGLGPTDSDSMQLTALQTFYGVLSDDKGRPRFDHSIDASTSLTTNVMRWVRLFRTDPKDQRELARLLDDDKPAVRWLGVKKATCLAQLDSLLRDKLRAMADGDPYVQVCRRLLHTDKSRPATPGMTANEFACPLRELACELLNRHGYELRVEDKAVAQSGVDRLVRIYDRDEKKRRSVLDAVTLLDPKGAAVAVLKQAGSKVDTNSTVRVLMRAIHESHE